MSTSNSHATLDAPLANGQVQDLHLVPLGPCGCGCGCGLQCCCMLYESRAAGVRGSATRGSAARICCVHTHRTASVKRVISRVICATQILQPPFLSLSSTPHIEFALALFARSLPLVLALFSHSHPLSLFPLPLLPFRALRAPDSTLLESHQHLSDRPAPPLPLSPLETCLHSNHNHVPWTVVQDRFRPSVPRWCHSHRSRRVMSNPATQICS